MNVSRTDHRLRAVVLFGIAYAVVGIGFPNPPSSDEKQFMWRLAAWLTSAIVFAIHIALEHVRSRSSPGRTALHVSLAVALGACALAVAANIHARTLHTGNQGLLALALVIWPIIAGLPAFVVALAIAVVLSRVRSTDTGTTKNA
jgi:hypothetical protein